MSDGTLVRIAAHEPGTPDLVGCTGRVVSLTQHAATIRLTSTGLCVTVPRCDLVRVDATPQSVRRWKAERLPWRVRNAAVIERMRRAA